MFKKIINFIKYSNVFTIVALVVFVAIASAIASNEDIVDKVLGEEIVETQGVDNTLLLATDLEDFDMEMKITNVTEDTFLEEAELPIGSSASDEKSDAGNYYIDYQYRTLGIQDDVWQEIFRQKQLVISKTALADRDLGLYVMEELGEIIDYEIAYLKEVQENEEEKGETFVVETTIYTGLIGLVFDTKTKKLPGYELVVKPPVVEETSPDDDAPHPNPLPLGEGDGETPDDYVKDSYYYEWLIGDCLSGGGYWYNSVCNTEPEITDPVCDADNIDLCTTQELCEIAGLYWYDNDDGNDVCNVEEEDPDGTSAPQPSGTMEPANEDPEDPEITDPVCDADNLDLCTDQDLCEGISLYWYDNNDDGDDVCNISQEGSTQSMEPTDAPAFTCDADHPTLCDAEEICKDMGLYWYGGECHLEEEAE